jgi:hypothetical protein
MNDDDDDDDDDDWIVLGGIIKVKSRWNDEWWMMINDWEWE